MSTIEQDLDKARRMFDRSANFYGILNNADMTIVIGRLLSAVEKLVKENTDDGK